MTTPDWIVRHRKAWNSKPALSGWYTREIFRRVDDARIPGRTLQLGYGPGLYGAERLDFVNVDLGCQDGVDVACDVHALPFAAESFANVVGIDVLHHFEAPGQALREIARVLTPGGKCLLVEPWAGAFGHFVYRFLHHEDCRAVASPWRAAFGPGKHALDGNAWIPRALLWSCANELPREAPGMALEKLETYGALGYLLTGGFGAFGAPDGLVRAATAIEAHLPQSAMRHLALRAFFVLCRIGPVPGASK